MPHPLWYLYKKLNKNEFTDKIKNIKLKLKMLVDFIIRLCYVSKKETEIESGA